MRAIVVCLAAVAVLAACSPDYGGRAYYPAVDGGPDSGPDVNHDALGVTTDVYEVCKGVCKAGGACHWAGDGKCRANSDADCLASRNCVEFGGFNHGGACKVCPNESVCCPVEAATAQCHGVEPTDGVCPP